MGSCDSFVVETDVHYPTDINLLLDALRKMITLITRRSLSASLSLFFEEEFFNCWALR